MSIVRSESLLVVMLVVAVGLAGFTVSKTRVASKTVENTVAPSGSMGSGMDDVLATQVDDAVWQLLMQAGFEEVATPEGLQWKPQFPPEVEELDGTEVRLVGYMIPLGYEEKQTHFLLSAFPGHGCYFHMPGGPESIMEVRATEGVAFSYDTISVEGRLELLHDDPYGLLYRLVDAQYGLGIGPLKR